MKYVFSSHLVFIPFRGFVVRHFLSKHGIGMRRIAGGMGGGGFTMSAQHRNVYQPSAMDDGIIYRPNPSNHDLKFEFYLLEFHNV